MSLVSDTILSDSFCNVLICFWVVSKIFFSTIAS
jgi:hypothetical protein